MSWGAVIAGGAALVGGAVSSNSSKKAAKTQAESTDKASQMQWDMYDQTRKDLDPYRLAGTNALSQLSSASTSTDRYTGTPFNFEESPSYQFRKQQGLDGIQSQAAAGGGLLSGATLKALNSYNSNLASQEHQQAFNNWQSEDNNAYSRYTTDQNNRFNRLSTLAGMGQNAAAQQGNAGMQTGQAVANNTMAGADALAAGQVASSNAWADSLGQVGTLAGAYLKNKNKTGGVI